MKLRFVAVALALVFCNLAYAVDEDPVVLNGCYYQLTKSELESFLAQGYRGVARVVRVRHSLLYGNVAGALAELWPGQDTRTAEFVITYNANDPAKKLVINYQCYLGVNSSSNRIHTYDCTSEPGSQTGDAPGAEAKLSQFTEIW